MPLERLKQQLLLHGLTCLRTAHPQYVASLEAQVLAGASFEQLRDEVAKYPTPRFEPWSEIFRLVVEVDLAGWRMSNSLKLLGFAPDQVQLDQMGVTASAWTDYHRMMWLVSSDGLLERMECLVKRVYREWIGSSEDKKSDLRSTLDVLKPHRDRVCSLRDAEVHGLGQRDASRQKPSTDVFRQKRHFEEWAVMGTWYGPLVLGGQYHQFQARWHGFFSEFSLTCTQAVEEAGRRLAEAVPWEEVAKRG